MKTTAEIDTDCHDYELEDWLADQDANRTFNPSQWELDRLESLD